MTKGWQKTTWVMFSANPIASTNQILTEDILQRICLIRHLKGLEKGGDLDEVKNYANR